MPLTLKSVLDLFLLLIGYKHWQASRILEQERVVELAVETHQGHVILCLGDGEAVLDPETAKKYAQSIIKASNAITR